MYRQSEKNLLSRNMSSTCPHNMVNFGPLAATGFASVQRSRHLVVGVSQICGVEQRAPPMFGRATITLGIGPHSSMFFLLNILFYGQG